MHKQGYRNRSNPKNYHSVSLTSLVCKATEHILVSQIMKHSELHNILTQMWHRFRSKHSCKAQPFLTTNDLAEAIDDKVQVYKAILGSSKAFDKVAHNGLKHIKLDFYGICGNLLKWLKSFLSNHIHAASAWWLVVPRVLVVLTLLIQPSYQGFSHHIRDSSRLSPWPCTVIVIH